MGIKIESSNFQGNYVSADIPNPFELNDYIETIPRFTPTIFYVMEQHNLGNYVKYDDHINEVERISDKYGRVIDLIQKTSSSRSVEIANMTILLSETEDELSELRVKLKFIKFLTIVSIISIVSSIIFYIGIKYYV